MLPKVERAPLLFVSVQKAIREYIEKNSLSAGDPLPPEGELARQLGVGRNSIREAIKALESLGVLEARRGKGIFVSDFSIESLLENLPYGLSRDFKDVAEVLELRRILEVNLVGRVAERISPDEVSRLRECVEAMRVKAARGEVFTDEDKEFHARLFSCLGNRLLLRILDIFWEVFYQTSRTHDITARNLERTYQNHVAIVDAIEKRDARQARASLDSHYDDLAGRIVLRAENSDKEAP